MIFPHVLSSRIFRFYLSIAEKMLPISDLYRLSFSHQLGGILDICHNSLSYSLRRWLQFLFSNFFTFSNHCLRIAFIVSLPLLLSQTPSKGRSPRHIPIIFFSASLPSLLPSLFSQLFCFSRAYHLTHIFLDFFASKNATLFSRFRNLSTVFFFQWYFPSLFYTGH